MPKQDPPSILTAQLRYERIPPSALKFADAIPTWIQSRDNKLEEVVSELLDEEWRVSHIRAELQRLNIQPQGRTRDALGAQLVSDFTDPERVTASLSTLSDDVSRCYLHLLLTQSLEKRYTTPASLETLCSLSSSLFRNQILDAGLAIHSESGKLYIPRTTLRSVPPGHIPLVISAEPAEFIPAKEPRDLLLQIQQIMGFFEGRTYQLRDRLRWTPPDYAYYRDMHCWPPHPDDAKLLLANIGSIRKITLWPPEPQLDEQSLQFWSESLNIPFDIVEFLYHGLMQSAILHAGSPVRINQTLVQEWLAQPPSRQIVILYQLYYSISSWAAWWPLWRDGQVTVNWGFQGLWGLSYIDATVLSTCLNLRRVLLDILSFLPQDSWLEIDTVVDWIAKIFPSIATQRYSQGITITGVVGGWKGWLKLTLTSILSGPLHYMGFADVAPMMEQVELFRLHHLQDVHWGRAFDLDTSVVGTIERDALHIDSASQNLRVTIPVPPDFLSLIQLWAKPDGLKGKTLHYHLDVERLHQAFERGNTPVDLRAAWKTCTGFQAPESLVQWWDHWWRGYGHIRLYQPQAILMTRDDFTMKELQLAIPKLKESIVSMVTPKTALIKSEHTDQVLADLERQGYMPKEES